MASQGTAPSVADNAQLPPVAIDHVALPNNTLLPLHLRLDRNNFSYWRVLVMAALRAYNLDGYVLGTIPQPPPTIHGSDQPNPHHSHWIRFDQFITHWILNSISENMLAHVVRCRTSAEIWTTLGRIFATKSKARILQLKGLLQSTKKGSQSVDDYILKMKTYADTLSEAGDPISDDNLSCMF